MGNSKQLTIVGPSDPHLRERERERERERLPRLKYQLHVSDIALSNSPYLFVVVVNVVVFLLFFFL